MSAVVVNATPVPIRRVVMVTVRPVALAYLVLGVGLVAVASQLDYGGVWRIVAGVLAAATIGGAFIASQHAGVGRGLAFVASGIAAIAAGGGFGLAHLIIEGLSLPGALVFPALPVGLALLAAGTVELVRATPGWWRLAAIPLAFVIFQFVALPLVVATGGAMQPRNALSAPMPAGAHPVDLSTSDGVTLRAWYTPSRNGAAVVLLPGSGGEKGGTIAHALVLARHGYGVLALDARGQGESDGVANAWGWRGTSDIAAALDFLSATPDVDPGRIGALGLSMGAEQALTAAATDSRIRAVVAEGASARTAEDVTWLGTAITDDVQRLMNPILWGLVDVLTESSQPPRLTDAVSASTAPTLLIVGNDPNDAGAAPGLIAAGGSHLEAWRLPDTPHMQALALHPAAWEARVGAFLDAHLTAIE